MKRKLWAVVQAHALGKKGIGLKYAGKEPSPLTVFDSKFEADQWLMKSKIFWKNEQLQGIRSADNFNPETGLDFAVVPLDWGWPEQALLEFKKKGWDLKAAKDFAVLGEIEEDEDQEAINRLNERMESWKKHQSATHNVEEQNKFIKNELAKGKN